MFLLFYVEARDNRIPNVGSLNSARFWWIGNGGESSSRQRMNGRTSLVLAWGPGQERFPGRSSGRFGFCATRLPNAAVPAPHGHAELRPARTETSRSTPAGPSTLTAWHEFDYAREATLRCRSHPGGQVYYHSTSDHPLPCHAVALTRFIGWRTIRPTVVK